MCGRFTLRTPAETIANLFDGIEIPELPPRYNIAPSQSVAAIRYEGGQPRFAWLKWGLVPFWATDVKTGQRMINARGETVREKPAFRTGFKKSRCLILSDGFYEWQKTSDGKQPLWFHMLDERPFCFAGLSASNRKTGDPVETCAVITTGPNRLMEPVHNRMPVILDTAQYDAWLDPGFADYDYLQSLLRPWPDEAMAARPVSSRVNKPSFDQPSCIEPVATQRGLDF